MGEKREEECSTTSALISTNLPMMDKVVTNKCYASEYSLSVVQYYMRAF